MANPETIRINEEGEVTQKSVIEEGSFFPKSTIDSPFISEGRPRVFLGFEIVDTMYLLKIVLQICFPLNQNLRDLIL
jgi:hypothetical protein